MSVDRRDETHANYLALVQKIDQLCATVSNEFAEQIHCRPGCSSCCREITVFPVEAAALLAAFAALPAKQATILAAAAETASDGSCPLLADGLCLAYTARPIICRTHGLPLLLTVAGQNRVDFCPENFRDLQSLPGRAIIDLERLNQALVTINALFVDSTADPYLKTMQRQSISALITLWKGLHHDAA